MRQELFNCALVITLALCLCLAGCEEHADTAPEQSKVKFFKKNFTTFIYSIEIEGHDYIIFDSYQKGGIIHSESCPCRKEAKK